MIDPEQAAHPIADLNLETWFTPAQHRANAEADSHKFTLFGGCRGPGKDMALDTPIPTPDGWTTMGAVAPGDGVIGPDGRPCLVIWASEVFSDHPCYRLTFDTGETIVAGEDHEWTTYSRAERLAAEFRTRTIPPPAGVTRTTQEIHRTLRAQSGREVNHSIRVCDPYDCQDVELSLDPYVLGAWLGDGAAGSGTMSGIDVQIRSEFERAGFTTTDRKGRARWGVIGLTTLLRSVGVFNNKHIPAEYLRASAAQRRALLQGLMDTDGYCDQRDGMVEFTNTNRALADGVFELVASLGNKPRMSSGRATLYGKDCGPKYRVTWYPGFPVFRLPRKLALQKAHVSARASAWHSIVRCDPVDVVPTRCIQVDRNDGLFLAGRSWVATHNSTWVRRYLARRHILLWQRGFKNVLTGLFCEDYPTLTDRQISKIATEFPLWLGELKQTQERGLGFHFRQEYGGGSILMRNLDDPSRYQSAEFAAAGVDELTKNKVDVFNALRGSLRWSGLTDQECKFVAGSNPNGIGHLWAKSYFIDHIYPKELAPASDQFIYVPALPDDNPFLDASYWNMLNTLPPELSRAWRWGDWDVFEGQAITAWNSAVHVIPPFQIPDGWPRWRGVDWGFSAPLCCLWFARDPNIGRIYVYREVYQAGLTDKEAAALIRDNTPADEQVFITYADPKSFWVRKNYHGRVTTPAEEYFQAGVPLTPGDNNRIGGKRKLESLLMPLPDGKPGLQVFSLCANLRRTLPALVYDTARTEDVDDRGEDHAYDALRLGLSRMAAPVDPRSPQVIYVNDPLIKRAGLYNQGISPYRSKDF